MIVRQEQDQCESQDLSMWPGRVSEAGRDSVQGFGVTASWLLDFLDVLQDHVV